VAYGTVLQEQRKLLHERTGQALEALYAATLHEHYDDLAHHYRRSANMEKAIHYFHLAGQQAFRRSAYGEAVHLFTQALDLLKMLTDTSERARRELALYLSLVPALQITQGLGSSEVKARLSRTQELIQQSGEISQLFQVLLGLRILHLVRGEWQKAQALGEQCLCLAQETKDQAFLLGAHHALGDTVYFLGEFASARIHQEQAIALYDPSRHHAQLFGQGYDLGMDARAHGAWVLWYLGYPDQALTMSQEALRLAQGLNDPYNLAHALWCVAWLHQLRREEHAVYERAESMMNLAFEHGLSHELMVGSILRGWALAKDGREKDGLLQIHQGLSAAGDAMALQPWGLLLLTETYRSAGHGTEGRESVEEALTIAEETGERLHLAELYRLRGELTLRKLSVISSQLAVPSTQPLTPSTQAEVEQEAQECFLKAIDIAQKQQAKSWELRAVMSLVRLRRQQVQNHAPRTTQHETRTRLNEAHLMLSEVYRWFTEGFDTKDLQEAKALLEELA
jgi:tetratricopeptide (TPR) repeat protein